MERAEEEPVLQEPWSCSSWMSKPRTTKEKGHDPERYHSPLEKDWHWRQSQVEKGIIRALSLSNEESILSLRKKNKNRI